MPVQVQQEQIDHCRVALTIDVPPEEIEKAVESVFNQFAKRTSVPGFRPGKAPRHLMKRYIDEGRVREVALDQALTNAYRDALRQTGVEPYREAEPDVELPEEDLDPAKGFSFKATVALQPHVHMGSLDDLSVRRVVTKFTDEDVTREIDRYREAAVTYEQSEEPAADGDRIRTTVEISVDGEPVPDLSFAEPTLIQVGANLPGLDEGLIGLKAGDENTFEFTLPEDFVDEARRGQTATARVQISEVLKRTVPEADDEFAKKAGFETLEALRARVREMLEAQANALADQEVRDELVREVVRRCTVHFPDEMVEREVSDRMASLIQALERRSLTLDDYLRAEKKDLAEFQTELREEATASLTNTLVLLEIARENKVALTERDVEEEIKARAESENVKLSQMRRVLNDTGEITALRNRVFFRKLTDFLQEKAQIREVEA